MGPAPERVDRPVVWRVSSCLLSAQRFPEGAKHRLARLALGDALVLGDLVDGSHQQPRVGATELDCLAGRACCCWPDMDGLRPVWPDLGREPVEMGQRIRVLAVVRMRVGSAWASPTAAMGLDCEVFAPVDKIESVDMEEGCVAGAHDDMGPCVAVFFEGKTAILRIVDPLQLYEGVRR
jgi:hypothetical protein